MTVRLANESPVTDVDGSQDKDGNRTYKITYLVLADPGDGPNAVLDCPGLPQPGNWYQMDGDSNNYAWCWWTADAKKWSPANEPAQQYKVTKTFSTKPEDTQHCREKAVEDPLNELPKISGSYSKYTEEGILDRFGRAITYSSFERIRGPQNEWDRNRISIKIQQNVASFSLGVQLPLQMLDCVNALPLWGLPARTIKLSTAPWEKKYYGPCIPYYVRTLDFDVRYSLSAQGVIENWDRYIIDESAYVLQGSWVGTGDNLTWVPAFQVPNMTGVPNPNNPLHYMKCKDVAGEIKKFTLNGHGVPAGVLTPVKGWYVSIAAGNVGNLLEDDRRWIPLADDPTVLPPVWNNNVNENIVAVQYPRGSLVRSAPGGHADICVAIQDNIGKPPAGFGADNANWAFVGAEPALPSFSGNFDITATYGRGNYVQALGYSGAAGYIFASRYPEVDFSLLGIPLTL